VIPYIRPHMKQAACILAAPLVLLVGCGSSEPPPVAVVNELSITIDANNNCTLEKTRVECRHVAAVIKTRYPTSKPRVDICLDKQARYEAAVEVMNSVSAAGFPVGNFDCKAANG
jgi:biopolymer transport protein ExbD